jgi:signal transduction histidine kinase/ActR/RegA family two-component response regulator
MNLSTSPKDHYVQFYESDGFLAQSTSQFIVSGITNDEGVIVVATPEHISLIKDILLTRIDLAKAIRSQQLLFLDAQTTLDLFMVEGLPQEDLYYNIIGGAIDNMALSFPVIRAYGEMVNLLWEKGNLQGTIALEELWNKLAKTRRFSVLCGYSMENFDREIDGVAFKDVCNCHSHVHPAESFLSRDENDEYRRLIAEMQQKNRALQTEVSERREIENELQMAKDAAENASDTKSRFLANMSHEIRSPLTAILGFAELLKDPRITEDKRANYLEVITRNGRQLSVLINDVLDLSKVEAGKLDIELIPMTLDAVVADVVGMFRPQAIAKGLVLRVFTSPADFPERFCSDPTRIHQILTNLIGNAVKFTQAGEIKISFSSKIDPTNGQTILGVRIDDTGIGMEADQEPKIFQAFIQADSSTTRKYGGTGLGLALSRRLANALGGDVVLLKTEKNKGSSFFFSFAANLLELSNKQQLLTPSFEDEKSSKARSALSGTRILLAEDSEDNQMLIRQFLSAAGASIEIAENGSVAVEKALQSDYDIILMDVMMPVCDGYEATRRLRSIGFRKPIVALTAHALREECERSYSEGCDEHLTKPINWRLLISTIEKLVVKNKSQ